MAPAQPDRASPESEPPLPAEHHRRRCALPLRRQPPPGAPAVTEKGEEGPDVPSLERRETRPGRHVGDRYVRIVRRTGSGLRGHGGRYVATEESMAHTGLFGRAWDRGLRFLIGRRLESEAESEERVGVGTGLPMLASDNVSSSAYATEEAMRILAIAGTSALALTMPIALAVVFVLAIVVLSEARVIPAYPNGGGNHPPALEKHPPNTRPLAVTATPISLL